MASPIEECHGSLPTISFTFHITIADLRTDLCATRGADSFAAAEELAVTTMTGKRSYHRRSDQERIAALQARISQLQNKVETKQRPDQTVVREAPKLQKKLRDFAQLAQENGRSDIANSTIAFIAGLDRMVQSPPVEPRKGRRNVEEELESDAFGH